MNQINDGGNNVNVTGSSNCEGITLSSGSGGQQPVLGRHKVTARLKWDLQLVVSRIAIVLITMSMQSGLKSWRKKD